MDTVPTTTAPPPAKTGRKRFVGRSGGSSSPSTKNPILSTSALSQAQTEDPLLKAAIGALLPHNYNFELPKSIAQIKKNGAKRVALQMPEGLAMYGCAIVDIIERFTEAECVIMGDVTYGACCIDDYTARALGCDMMIHYGHSCLVPVDTTTIKTLYVFVEISVDRPHLAASVRLNFPHCIPPRNSSTLSNAALAKGKGPELEIAIEPSTQSATTTTSTEQQEEPQKPKTTKLAVVGTIQFVAAVQGLKSDLEVEEALHSDQLAIEAPPDEGSSSASTSSKPNQEKREEKFDIIVPQVKPLSPGEILGCTAPRLADDVDALLYVGDGRFHLESIMIANPQIPAFRYDPYTKRLTRELYDHEEMRKMRGKAVEQARDSLVEESKKKEIKDKEAWGIVLGTLGRQGNLRVLKSVTKHLEAPPSSSSSTALTTTSSSPLTSTPFIPFLLSELSPAKLSLLTGISTFVQTSCPRLSIDWGYAFPKPLLSPYEASVAMGVHGARGWKDMGIDDNKSSPKLKELENGRKGDEDYPMDFYADGSLGEWTPRFGMGVRKAGGEKGRPVPKSKRMQQQQQPVVAATT
ncbi:2-(3-amino-3-carboxypropyl)histidine synthase [Sporobolomyces salmoneus]|uniref:2-(3-amino-3-carboxypropyl)histidine synthase n=1 Tax=Sporobolomyces salmoneus TaxID=183962 RepID=UPI00317E02C5